MAPPTCRWCGGQIRPICGDVAEEDHGLGNGWYHRECLEPMWDRAAYYEFDDARNYTEWLEAQCSEASPARTATCG